MRKPTHEALYDPLIGCTCGGQHPASYFVKLSADAFPTFVKCDECGKDIDADTLEIHKKFLHYQVSARDADIESEIRNNPETGKAEVWVEGQKVGEQG